MFYVFVIVVIVECIICIFIEELKKYWNENGIYVFV